ncbi:MAG: hypothetical protein DWQ31_04980 [Planctomycetota bacterium]|nr:MAG: hypothetical protein DWQ31_04980 [Planctomycetota bacterium]REJ87890.1 MAG: hypothetical protein DWQ35_20870 [Planctomycetota bacterium]REK26466.1 MAG: hypothetical protein DWQ42_09080 [Planctomycetota bacterium]REK38696.1 MAG: hypothetical protein DWQ46_19895 [Planctomycetota bacterium]
MKIPRHWARGVYRYTESDGREAEFGCWGWSNRNLEEAAERGRQRAEQVMTRVLRGDLPDRYLYSDRPLREEILEEFTSRDGEPQAVITRNAYGCHVLNTAQIAFIDVDKPRRGWWSLFGGLLGALTGRRTSNWEAGGAERSLTLRNLLDREKLGGVRIYATKAGERYLLTGTTLDPAARQTHAWMEELGSDALYRKLCQVQECFRARLTPKPWRCGIRPLTIRFPWRSEQEQAEHRRWETAYLKRAEGFATCRLVNSWGDESMSEEIRPIVELHDTLTKAKSDLPLA